jgi:site-specific recombinase XerD
VEALRDHRVRQARDRLAAGPLWQDHGLVFASAVGTPMDDHNVRRMFRAITEEAGLGTGWVPREMRHTFVSLLSARGVPVEAIALLAGAQSDGDDGAGLPAPDRACPYSRR